MFAETKEYDILLVTKLHMLLSKGILLPTIFAIQIKNIVMRSNFSLNTFLFVNSNILMN